MSVVVENPRGSCVLGGVSAVLGAVHKFCPIFHSGPGCCMQTSAGEHNTSSFLSSVSIPSTNMMERDVVFGGEKKLRSTIAGAVEIIDADAYFVLTGCTAGIIGEDIESVVKEFREKGARIFTVDTPGFAGDSALGYETAFKIFLDNIVEEGLPKEKNLVNLFGIMPYKDPFWSGNLEELTRILKKLGLKVNTFFSEHQGYENIRTSSAAELNIIVNPYLLNSASRIYEERFGVPTLRISGLPIGATDTTDFVRQVGNALELDSEFIERVIEEEEDYIYSYLAQMGNNLGWNKFGVVADSNLATGITRFLANDYGQTPQVVIVTEPMYRQQDKDRIIKQLTELEYAKPPVVIFEPDQFKLQKELEQFTDLAMLVGSSNEKEYCDQNDIFCSVQAFPIIDRTIINRTIIGYRGSLTLVEDLFNFL